MFKHITKKKNEMSWNKIRFKKTVEENSERVDWIINISYRIKILSTLLEFNVFPLLQSRVSREGMVDPHEYKVLS